MKIVYISEGVNICEASDDELKLITGDENLTPVIGQQINVGALWAAWAWICSKKQQILTAANNLQTLHSKLP